MKLTKGGEIELQKCVRTSLSQPCGSVACKSMYNETPNAAVVVVVVPIAKVKKYVRKYTHSTKQSKFLRVKH